MLKTILVVTALAFATSAASAQCANDKPQGKTSSMKSKKMTKTS